MPLLRKRSTRIHAVSLCSFAGGIDNENDDEHEHDSEVFPNTRR
jgi:hypothetical protein